MKNEQWATRWSPAEMMYLEVREDEVVMFLDHAPTRPDRFTFQQVLSGEAERWYLNEFGKEVAAKVKAAVERRIGRKKSE